MFQCKVLSSGYVFVVLELLSQNEVYAVILSYSIKWCGLVPVMHCLFHLKRHCI